VQTSPRRRDTAARNFNTAWKTGREERTFLLGSRVIDRLKKLPELRDVASDQSNGGLLVQSIFFLIAIPLPRLGMLPADMPPLYDAFGQRRFNKLHPAQPVSRRPGGPIRIFSTAPDSLKNITSILHNGTQVPAPVLLLRHTSPSALALKSYRVSFRGHTLVNLAPALHSETPVTHINRNQIRPRHNAQLRQSSKAPR